MEKLLKTGFYNNRFTNASQIRINPDSLAVGRSYAAFEFFRIINKRPFYIDRHLDRLMNTLSILRLKIKYTKEQLHEIIHELIQKNEQSDYFLKIYALPGNSLNLNEMAKLLILPYEIEYFDQSVEKEGVNLISKEYSRFLPEAKSTNYIASIFWQSEMEVYNAVDVLYYINNQLLESSRGNVFVVKNGIISTPAKNVLKGITKSILMDIIPTTNWKLEEKTISMNELYDADEVFLSSTTKMVMPVIRIDDKVIANGKPGIITTTLLNLFVQHLNSWKQIYSTIA